jgi:hypothetical protein
MILIDLILNVVTLSFLLGIPVGIAKCIAYFVVDIKCHDLIMQYRFFGGSCWGMRGCGKDNCHIKCFCPVYQNTVSPELIAELERKLEKRRKELEGEKLK